MNRTDLLLAIVLELQGPGWAGRGITATFTHLLETGELSFTDGWDEEIQKVPNTRQFEAVARSPIVQRGQVVAATGLAVTDQPH